MRELKLDGLREILAARVAKSRHQTLGQVSAFNVGAFDTLQSVRVLARIDGVMVVEIGLDQSVYARHLSTDLDELAQFVCSCAKSALGHVHDSHNSILPWSQQDLDPERLLVVYPVRVSASRWKPLFDAENFTDADIKATNGIPPKNAPIGPPRNALLCLRRAYLKVFEQLLGRLEIDRKRQVTWKRRYKYLISALGLFASSLLFIGLGYARSLDALSALDVLRVFLVLLGPQAFAFFLYYLAQFWLWDRRRIRLIRASRTFFAYANPYNRVAGVALDKPNADSFDDIQTVLQTKVDGEVHRAHVHQFWMSLCVGVVGTAAALLALDKASTTLASSQASAVVRQLEGASSRPINASDDFVEARVERPPATPRRSSPSALAWCSEAHSAGGAIVRRCGP